MPAATTRRATKQGRTTAKAAAGGGVRRVLAPRMRTITPYLVVADAARAIEWYRRAFDAKVLQTMPGPQGKILHAEIMVGDSRIMLSDVFPGADMQDPQALGGTAAGLHLHHKDVDRVWKKAVEAGATVTMPLDNQFWGDRYGKLRDPFGHVWSLAYKAKMSKEEKQRKQEEAMRMFASGQP